MPRNGKESCILSQVGSKIVLRVDSFQVFDVEQRKIILLGKPGRKAELMACKQGDWRHELHPPPHTCYSRAPSSCPHKWKLSLLLKWLFPLMPSQRSKCNCLDAIKLMGRQPVQEKDREHKVGQFPEVGKGRGQRGTGEKWATAQ